MLGRTIEQACPSVDDITAFVDRRLAHPQSRALEAHFARCSPCRELLSALARTETTESGALDSRALTMPVSDGELTLGPQFGRYVVLDWLGAGGMGVVYSAHDTELDRRVALKVLRGGDGPAGHSAVHERLLREARAMAQLAHPNVVTVFDAGSADGLVYLAMELVDGLTLRKWLAAKPRSWSEIVAVFVAAGNGLAAAHAAGLVHRDFKPDNVIIGNDGRVRVTDFGLARAAGRLLEATARDRPGAPAASGGPPSGIVGTPAYMAPEQYLGRADARADQYSFAVALHEALLGWRPTDPLRCPDPAAPRLPRDSAVPAALHRALLRALRSSPDERYPSMVALLAALASPPRRRRGLAIGALAIAAAAVVSAGYAMHLRAISSQRTQLVGRWRGLAAELRTQLRTAHTLPLHDLRPEREQVRRAMDDVKREQTTPAGQEESGLADYVLGEGHRALGDNAQALTLLEAAWAAGERGPHIDLALGDVLGAAYESELSDLETTVRSSERAAKLRSLEQRYRVPALAHLRASLDAGVGSRDYLAAQIAFHNHDFTGSIQRAHAAFSESPTLYEAGVLEAKAHNEMGRARLATSHMDEASAEFATARQIFEHVLEIARSDDQAWASYAQMISAQVNALGQGVLLPDLQRKARDALHVVQQLNPGAWEPVLSELAFHQEEANNAIFLFRDPSQYVDQMLALTTVARERGAPGDQVDLYVCLAQWERAVYQGSHGVDPRASFQQAIAACERAAAAKPDLDKYDSLGVVYSAQAAYLADHGGDPMPAFALGERNLRAALAIDDQNLLHYNLGALWNDAASYQQAHGLSAAHAIEQALAELDSTIARDAMRGDAWGRKALALITRAKSRRGDPMGERAALNEARADLDRAVELEPALTAPRRYRISLAELDAELLLADRTSPIAATDAMRSNARLLLHDRPEDGFAHRALCRAELFLARWELAQHRPAERLLAGAATEAARARSDDALDASAWMTSADVELVRAEAARARGNDPAPALAEGTAYVEHALAIDPGRVEARELRDALTQQRVAQP